MSARVIWHALQREGSPYLRDALGRPYHVGPRWTGNSGGEGCGLCECGAMSGVLPSAAQRKAWHREHKAQVISGEWTTEFREVQP